METKVCSKCGIEKNTNEFYTDKQKKDRLSSNCKLCINSRMKKFREENPQLIKERKKLFYKKNSEKILKKNNEYKIKNEQKIKIILKKYQETNKEQITEKRKKKYQQNRLEILSKQKEYNIKNFEKKSLYLKEYYENNKEKLKEYRYNYIKQRRKNDVLFYLRSILSHRLREFLKTRNMSKNNRTFEIIGCTPEFLKKHLEKQFKDGMSWDKMGKEIHIDHIIPLSSAKTEEELYKLCHYTNLQPLWAEENMKKGNKIIEQLKNNV